MNLNIPAAVKYSGDKKDPFIEVLNTEKHLLALIYSKGLLDKDVQELYRKACSDCVNIILSDNEAVKLQEVEYFIWKLHYIHIEEFRKRIRQFTVNAQSKKTKPPQNDSSSQVNLDRHMEGFRTFLSEATAFYENLIRKLRGCYGLPLDLLLSGKTDGSASTEPTKFNRIQYACHRLLICLGDIARYKEFCKKPDARNWSVAAAYYLEAAQLWPDSGNPHNQLALLATYVGDSFLALYHCLRSLAVKEPFPDAVRNLKLLIEENRSSHLHLSREAHIDFSRPFETILKESTSDESKSLSNSNKSESTENVSSAKSDLWLLFVRMISFFLEKTSMEDFPCTLASTIRELEDFLSLNDDELQDALLAYQNISSSKGGPHRALQLVSILIFTIHSLTEDPEKKKVKDEKQQFALIQLALASTFLYLGRLTERCLKSEHLEVCSLLPAVLEFVEWLVTMLDKAEEYATDRKVTNTMSYFFCVLVDLLNRLDHSGKVSPVDTPIWEDLELQGFEPVAHAHAELDFRSNQENKNDFSCSYHIRALRILNAAINIAQRNDTSGRWLIYDVKGRKFCKVEAMEFPEKGEEVAASISSVEVKGMHADKCGNYEERKDQNFSQSVTVEEEEVILFKPITRHNSAPIYSISKTDILSTENTDEKDTSTDESLRRATSLVNEQHQIQTDSFSFHPDTTNFKGNKPFKQLEPLFKDSTSCAVGPPSLSAWVFNQGNPKIERDEGLLSFTKRQLSPIEEIASESLTDLVTSDIKHPLSGSEHVSASAACTHPPAYVAPVPSAPLLPDDAIWFTGNSPTSHGFNRPIGPQDGDGILGASPISGYSNLSATRGPVDLGPRISGIVDGYPPLLGMSSSEWLYHYRNSNNIERSPHHKLPLHLNAPGLLGTFHSNDISRYSLFDQWGNYLVSDPMVYLESPQLHPMPLVYGADVQIGEKFGSGYPRAYCGTDTGLRAEQPPLLQYLKEKERKMQRESHLGGPTFLGS